MISNIQFCCLSSLVLLNLVGAKPLSNLQSLKELLEEESNVPYYASDETDVDDKDLNTGKAAFTAEEVHPWVTENGGNSALSGKENELAPGLDANGKVVLAVDQSTRNDAFLNFSTRMNLFNSDIIERVYTGVCD
ncbi:hypothetical protein UPYG_G00010480 [Umbra pygmaea]|uniref:Uncharacterized protein n=1 Tax=Umbra pygmaea TaxID=75934 RepID=A0ABD0XIN7_UMBPY